MSATLAVSTAPARPLALAPGNLQTSSRWAPLQIVDAPTTADICAAVIFDHQLIPVGEPTDQQNQDLLLALQAFGRRSTRDDFSSLTSFVALHPDNPWTTAVQTQLGQELYRTGRYSSALNHWKQVWDSNKTAPTEEALALAHRSASQLAMMYSRLGRMAELRPLLAELGKRSGRGLLVRELRAATDGLWSMEHRPEVSFRCGPLALDRICFATDRSKAGSLLVENSQSTTNGFSARQVAELSRQLGMDYQVAFRSPGAAVILPAVIHWKVGHYAALIARDGNLIRAEDPTFGNMKIWLSDAALDAEASGYFLVRPGALPPGWRKVGDSEAAGVWGKGTTQKSDQDSTTDDDAQTCKEKSTEDNQSMSSHNPNEDPGTQSSHYMPQWNVHLMLASHHVQDTPIGYAPPVGPAIFIRASYDAINGWPDYGLPFSNISQEWRLNWLTYVTDDPMNPAGDVQFAADGGGTLIFSDYNPTNQVYQNLFRNRATLLRTGTNSYELRYPNGSKKIFSRPDNSVGTLRKVFMTAIVDPAGNAATLDFDLAGRILGITDALGQKTQFFYDLPVTNVVPTLRWVPPYILTRVVDPFGRTATFEYTSAINARMAGMTDVIGLSSSFQYDYNPGLPDLGMIALITPYGTTKFSRGSYNGLWRANWVEITYPNGEKERVEYSEIAGNGVPSSESLSVVPKGVPVRNYILYGRNTYHWDRRAYASAYSTLDYSGAKVYHWAHELDYTTASPILESFKAPLEHRVWFNYDGQVNASFAGSSDQPTKISRTLNDGTTQLSQTEYNSLSNPTKVIDPLGREFTLIYDSNDVDLVEMRQTRAGQNEVLLSATYNNQHLPLSVTDAGKQTTLFGYNSRGQLTAFTNALGNVTTLSYDVNGYLISVDGPLPGTNDTRRFTYDPVGRLRTVTDPDGYTVTIDYDDGDRPTRITYPDATYEQITYDRLDPVVLRDRAGRETRLTYDSLRQLVSIQDPLGRVTRAQWCGCGGLESLVDPQGRATSWTRDLQGRLAAKTYPNGGQVHFEYDPATGWLSSVRDERNQLTVFDYNLDGSLRQKRHVNAILPTPDVSFAYDPNYARVICMQDGVGTTTYTYYPITGSAFPGAGNLASTTGPFANDVVTYTYDGLGRVAMRAINGVATRRNWDEAGRLTQLTNALGVFAYSWEGASRRLSTTLYPNGQATEYAYYSNTGDQLLQRISHRLEGGGLLSEFTHGYNELGRITNWTQLQGGILKTWAPQYDAADRLMGVMETASLGTSHSYTYDYDPSDNRTVDQTDLNRTEFFYNIQNQLVGSTNSQSTVSTYAWDAAHRLVGITNGTHSTAFAYDGFDRRARIVEKESGAILSDRHYLWCGSELCEERDSSGSTVLKRFFYDGLRAENGSDLPAGNYFFTRDHLRSIREMTDNTGALRAQSAYSPFGVRQSLGGDLRPDFGFTGHYEHQYSGLDLALYRSYSPQLGRWLNRDPIGEMGGLNLYQYALNDPINVIDLYGLTGSGWGLGISGEVSFVQPLSSGGGSAAGLNLQLLSKGPDEGLALYTYSPGKDNSVGVNIGASLQFNITWGDGEWTGLFNNYALGVKELGVGYFQSPCPGENGEEWKGVSLGVGVGPLPLAVAAYQTDYTKVSSIGDDFFQWLGNALGGGQHWGP